MNPMLMAPPSPLAAMLYQTPNAQEPALARKLREAKAREMAAMEAAQATQNAGGFGRAMGDVGVNWLRALPFVGRATGDALRPEQAELRKAQSERMALLEMAMKDQAGAYTLTPGAMRYDAMNRPTAMAPFQPAQPKDTRTSLMKEAYELYPNDPAARQRYIEDARKKAGTTVNVNTAGEKAEAVALGTGTGEYYWKTVVPDADNASDLVSNLNYAESLIPVSGFFTPERTKFYNALAGFGVDIGEPELQRLQRAQTLEALINIVALGRTSQLKGQISEKELDFIKRSVMGMRNTPEANRMIIKMMRSMASMKIYRRQFFDRFKEENPKESMRTAAAKWNNFRSQHMSFKQKDGRFYYFDDYVTGVVRRGGTITDAMEGWKAWT